MIDILDMITSNLFLFIAIMIGLFAILILLIYFVRKTSIQIPIYEEDLDKDELNDVKIDQIDTYDTDLENVTDEEIIERVEQENKQEEKEVIENSAISDIESLLSKMREDRETKPEEVVAKFEQEQEENSIISYQELVEMVKNNRTMIYDDETCELPTTSSMIGDYNFIEAETDEEIVNGPTSEDVLNMIKKVVNNSKQAMINEEKTNDLVVEIEDNSSDDKTSGKFKPEEFISPVFGRMNPDIEYNTIPKFDKKTALTKYNLELGEKTLDLEKLDLEIKRNEEFLQALKDFRNSL